MDIARLSQLWEQRWPGCSKVPYLLRGLTDRWVRFHTLPGSKRYPETEAEYNIILGRHHTVLTELVTAPAVLVVTPAYSDQPTPPRQGRSAEATAVQPGATYWTSACIDDEPDSTSWIHFYVSETPWVAAGLDPLLRHVADDIIANVLITDVDLQWLYHPYDGGMDVILPTTAERDSLRRRHSEWLSAHPTGL
ncbi:DUF3885 domain-containing protein [Virgisporangium aurantiacum]|uniref:DUF3885 domain-containing protein n=1 Tax=Virgisporangium aurantiacum TaxID=175570 RepID=UPI001EF26B64|nr:hypothetical protein [Virgisporangium aurantiacum]